ncbi:hypothetical protein [Synechocystis sp. PCC 7509]|uniref:hypothetical protein n=1 Tax=Synechocystis sp. PCC 7509 TaxID=927677 RepID=UPI0002ACD45C|nr:hypothetical protein [Synechocystis sp. PCC 7509]
MKSFGLFQEFVARRSPPTPLKKGGEDGKVTIKAGCLEQFQVVTTFLASFDKTMSFGGLLLIETLVTTPANAHKIEIHKDVGATIHIEPNDSPRAGETALTWFALTQKGGKIISLNECNCKLSVYSQSRKEDTLQQPPLKPVSQERYRGIPGAEITFPAAGAYQLQLQGSPKNGGTFSPFELKFDINVAPGIAAPKSRDIKVSPGVVVQKNTDLIISQTTPPWLTPAIVIGTILTIAIALLVWRKLQRHD